MILAKGMSPTQVGRSSQILLAGMATIIPTDERVPINAELRELRAFDLDYSYGPAIGKHHPLPQLNVV